MEKISSKFWFKSPYVDEKDKPQYATVVLEIDYKTKSYSITPYCGTINNGFTFVNSSHKWRMWLAILACINNAIAFANKDLVEAELGNQLIK